MEKPLPFTDQKHISELFKERFDNPESFTDKPLIIWRSNLYDGVHWSLSKIMSECYKEDKKEKDYHPALRKLHFNILKENGIGVRCINPQVNKICVVYVDIEDIETNAPISFETYSSLITIDWLKRLNKEFGVPIILHLPFIEHPEAFEGVSQYIFKPDYNEWKEDNLRPNQDLFLHLIGFLESAKNKKERDYRWYWYFQRQLENENSSDSKFYFEKSGCDFPSCWMWGLYKLKRNFILPMAQIPKNYIPPKPTKISEIPTDEFKGFFNKGISDDLIEDFRNYLIDHNVEIQGNKRPKNLSEDS